jgi:hypothetical protein
MGALLAGMPIGAIGGGGAEAGASWAIAAPASRVAAADASSRGMSRIWNLLSWPGGRAWLTALLRAIGGSVAMFTAS